MCPIRRNSLLVHVAYPKYLGQMALLLLLLLGFLLSGDDFAVVVFTLCIVC